MSLSNTSNKLQFSPSSPTTVFNFNIKFFNEADIVVTALVSGATSEVTLTRVSSPSSNTEYKVDPTGGDPANGADITIGGAGYTSGDKVTIERIVSMTQEYDLQDGAAIDPTALNTGLDRAVAQNQQQQQVLDNSLSFPVSDADSITYNITESATSRANKLIGFDSDGDINTQTFSTVAGDAVTGGNGIDITGNQVSVDVTSDFTFSSGQLQLATDSVDTAEIKANAVDTAEIKDNAVTTAKLPDSTSTSDGVTLAKLQHIATDKVLGRTTASDGDVELLDLKDEDTMTSNSDTAVATQQSIKAYVDLYKPNVVGNHFKTKSGHTLTNNSNTFVEATNFQTTITPKVASSKILISGTITAGNTHPAHYLARIQVKVASGSFSDITPIHSEGTEVNSHFVVGDEQSDDNHSIVGTGYNFLHTPSYSVGESLTYTLTFGAVDSTNSSPAIYINRSEDQGAADDSNGTSSMILQEIYA
jgi:hypothetical protein|tara:strand:+ start:3011 stop:4435 length:1425 start_codon:yes stop_codon:yes gene_type:complete